MILRSRKPYGRTWIDEIETIGGYVTALLGRVPAKGEKINAPNGVVFTVLEGDSRRLKRIRIAPPAASNET